jgi:putative ABC transport system ATP-binding protein
MPQVVGSLESPVAIANGVSKSYRLGETIVSALRGVSLAVSPGEFVGLAGPSGSGKSTLLHLLGCLDHPDAGAVLLGDLQISKLAPKQLAAVRRDRLGFIFQTFNLVPVLTAFENVEYPQLLTGTDPQARRRRVMELLDRVGLGAKARRRPDELSGGERQRVAIARALVNRPALVLADEPTANLDGASSATVLDVMGDLRKSDGAAFIVASHDPRVLERMDRLVVLRDGVVVDEARRRVAEPAHA